MTLSERRARLRVAATIAFSLVLSLAPCLSSQAIVPDEMNYQGLLLDDLGDPVTGSVEMVFTLFDSLIGGTSLWTETHATVEVVDGIYQVSLGETTPLDAALTIGGSLFLEIAVDGAALTPRQQLLVVPYALRAAVAEDAQQVDGLSSAFLTELFEHFSFDGADPPNLDPQEGLADTDGDGVPNFLDTDNDGDGLSDSTELLLGTDLNLATPTIESFSPPSFIGGEAGTVTISGQNFVPGLTVQFGGQNPTPTSITATSFEVPIVGTEPLGFVSVTVTLPNGQDVTDTDSFEVFPPIRVIFVTAQSSTGDLGGIAGADATCNSLAQTAGLSGTFQAWLADSTVSPATRETKLGAPYVLVDGTVVANDWADLTDGDIAVQINRDQNGIAPLPPPASVWTNVTVVGASQTGLDHCADWTSNSSGVQGERGATFSASSGWTELGDLPCDSLQHIYCVEQ